MKSFSLLIPFLFFFSLSYSQKTMRMSRTGFYTGKNLYVQNPYSFADKDTGFCTIEVWINELPSKVNLESSAYEIDLSHLSYMDSVRLVIVHKTDCKPKILNPYGGCGHRSFYIKKFEVKNDQVLWSLHEKPQGGSFFLERFENNTWTIKSQLSISDVGKDSLYGLPVTHHSGENKYRIKHVEKDGQVTYSSWKEFRSGIAPLKIEKLPEEKKILFSRETEFELLDHYGHVLQKGTASSIYTQKLDPGIYYLNADNHTFKIKIKKE